MINLLEKKDQRAIKWEYYRRLAVVASLMIIALLGISLLVAGTFYQLQLTQKQLLEDSLAGLTKESGVKEAATFVADQDLANLLIARIVSDKVNLHAVSALLEAVSQNRPAGVKLATIGLERGADGQWLMKLAGQAARRTDLITFTDALKLDKTFSAVDSPFSNLIKEFNSEFVINLILAPLK